VTLALLWQEYKEKHPGGYRYSWFCHLYKSWAGKLDLVLRQEHRAGEKMFVDYAGQTVPIVNRVTGEIRQAQVFVAVLGASNSPMRKPPGARDCLTGLAPMSGLSPFSTA
jgi:transposase